MMNTQHCKLALFHGQARPDSVNFWPGGGKEDILGMFYSEEYEKKNWGGL